MVVHNYHLMAGQEKKKRKSNIKLTNLKRMTPMMTQNDRSRNFSLHC